MSRFLQVIFMLIGLSIGSVRADDNAVSPRPIEWQKVELQQQIEASISRSVQTVVDPAKFHVSVEVRLSAPRTFGAGQGAAQQGKDFPLAKLGINKESAAYQKAITSGEESIFTRIAGIVVNLSFDNSVSGNAERQAKELVPEVLRAYTSANLDLKVRRFAFHLAPAPSVAGAEAAKANLEAAKTLAEAIAQSNSKIAEAINLFQTRQSTQGPVKQSDAPVPATSIELRQAERTFPKTWQHILLEFQIPIGILIATLLFMLSIGSFKKIESQKVAVMAASNQARAAEGEGGGEERAEATIKDAISSVGGTVAAVSGTVAGGESAFDQFRRVSENSPDAASYLLKSWINMDSEASREAIATLTKVVAVESLVPIVQSMSEDLKARFKRASQTPVDAAAMQRAENFIVEQMVENFLVNAVDLPPDIKGIMSGMSIQEAIECVKKDKKLGGIFVNVLQTGQVVKLLRSLPDADANAVLQEGTKYSPDSLSYLSSTLGALLTQMRSGKKENLSPFAQRGVELVGAVGPEREAQVLQALLASGAKDQVVEATQRYYPAELLLTFPADKLRVLMGRLSAKQRAALIYSRSDKDKKTLLAAIGETGRVREMINEELREIEKSDTQKAQIKKNGAKIWQEFVVVARETIRSDLRVKEASEEILKKWLMAKGIDANRIAAAQAA